MFNHVEYDSTSLADEYFRDVNAGVPIKMPYNYFPHNDVALPPQNRWRSMRIFCSATGSTRSTRPRLTIWRRSARNRLLILSVRSPLAHNLAAVVSRLFVIAKAFEMKQVAAAFITIQDEKE